MKHSTQVRLLHEIFDTIDRGTPPMAEKFTRNDTSAYTSPRRSAKRSLSQLIDCAVCG